MVTLTVLQSASDRVLLSSGRLQQLKCRSPHHWTLLSLLMKYPNCLKIRAQLKGMNVHFSSAKYSTHISILARVSLFYATERSIN